MLNPEHPKVTNQIYAFVEGLTKAHPVFGQAQVLAREFCRLIRERDGSGFSSWLEAALGSEIGEIKGFARGLVQDRAAVEKALSCEWSNGQVEGQVNRLKYIKRSMYGRGGFDMLKARVLHRAAA